MFTLWELQFKVANSLEIIFSRVKQEELQIQKRRQLFETWDCANLQGYGALLD